MSPASRNNGHEDEGGRLARKREALFTRAALIRAVRRFFYEHDYLEADTPNRVPSIAPEVHIDGVPSGDWYLHTSPELCMKRLVAAGYHSIFQISKCYRHGERGRYHLPEFSLLEWYRAGIDYRDLMDECEAMVRYAVTEAIGRSSVVFHGRAVNVKGPWQRLTVRDAFTRYAACSADEAVAADTFDDIMTAKIEPHLGAPRPTFLYDYPSTLASLARVKDDDPSVAERCELYMAGVELANGFSELTDPDEQRQRFDSDNTRRRDMGKHQYPPSEKFLAALGVMPETAGIALGIDRLAMILANVERIDDVVAFTPEDL